ncbi:DEKNAAC102632 [Brettanomyces naardenensis]|uniref:DEKNAAC102632 n=1 Tax=Brettanomyces naardenensis TaxID=13370 RepID=A0A448YLB8_BRENA|nr:DEKNAAC102632 [Brettanomyces naardenensis]
MKKSDIRANLLSDNAIYVTPAGSSSYGNHAPQRPQVAQQQAQSYSGYPGYQQQPPPPPMHQNSQPYYPPPPQQQGYPAAPSPYAGGYTPYNSQAPPPARSQGPPLPPPPQQYQQYQPYTQPQSYPPPQAYNQSQPLSQPPYNGHQTTYLNRRNPPPSQLPKPQPQAISQPPPQTQTQAPIHNSQSRNGSLGYTPRSTSGGYYDSQSGHSLPPQPQPLPQPQIQPPQHTQSTPQHTQSTPQPYSSSSSLQVPSKYGRSGERTSVSSSLSDDPSRPSTAEQDRINQLEDKVQRLERALRLQEVKESNESDLSLGSDDRASARSGPKKKLQELSGGSSNSLIPSEDRVPLENQDTNTEKPSEPYIYEELESPGSLTYSKSIYRTGFEKAGFQMNHFKNSARRRPIEEEGDEYNLRADVVPPPPEIDEEPTEPLRIVSDRSMSSSVYSDRRPSNHGYNESRHRSPTERTDRAAQQQSEFAVPKPKPSASRNNSIPFSPVQANSYRTESVPKSVRQDSIPSPISSSRKDSVPVSVSSRTIQHSHTSQQSQQSKPSVLKYSKLGSYKKLSNGIIEPILPSKSSEPLENVVARFRTTREKALHDYKSFTPRIQFDWAITLLETMARPDVLSKMAIDGKLRRRPIPHKSLRPQRRQFLTTSVKVLEKLVQVSPTETRARLYLADIYSGGIHPGVIEKDEKAGFEMFLDSATKQRDPVACYRIACCLEAGVGCRKDVEQSCKFFNRAASLGDPSAMCQLGMMYFAGVNGYPLDIAKSLQWHMEAAEKLYSFDVMGYDPLISARSFSDARGALYTLAKLHQTDLSILCLNTDNSRAQHTIDELRKLHVFRNKSKALRYYLDAAKTGHAESQASLGYYYSKGFFPTSNFKPDRDSFGGEADPVDPRRSVYWFSKAAQNNHAYAALGLAKWYGSGAPDGTMKKDEQQAFLWGRKAADEGQLPEAEFMIGMCFEQGFGSSKNRQMAVNYYQRSASKGYKKAMNKLKGMAGEL